MLAGLVREGPLTRIRLPFGKGWAWPATCYEDVTLIFGNGPHRCTGAALARLQLEPLGGTLPDRLPGLRLAMPPEQVQWRHRTVTRGPRTLPVTR